MTERSNNQQSRAVAFMGLIFALGLLAVTFLAGGDPPSVRQEEAATTSSSASAGAPTPSTAPEARATTTSTSPPPAPTTPAPTPPSPRREPAPRVAPAAPSPSPATSPVPLSAAWLAAGARNVAPGGAAAASPGGGPAPVRIEIPAIGVSAPVDPLSLNSDGTMQVPEDFSRTGYYTGRPVPGEVGPSIIVGHVDSRRGPAVFYRLRHLEPGAEVVVHRADRSVVTFVVERSKQVPKSEFPTDEVYGPTPDPTLRLVTCGGSFDRRSGHYRDNTIVFLRMKG